MVDGLTRRTLGFTWRGIDVFIFVNVSSMYVQYKVNVSENQVDTLKDAIDLRKAQLSVFQKVVSEVIVSCYLHQHKSTDWTRHKWKGDVHKFV